MFDGIKNLLSALVIAGNTFRDHAFRLPLLTPTVRFAPPIPLATLADLSHSPRCPLMAHRCIRCAAKFVRSWTRADNSWHRRCMAQSLLMLWTAPTLRHRSAIGWLR